MGGKTKVILAVLLTFSFTCILFISIFNSLGISVWGGKFSRLEAVGRIIESRYIGDFDYKAAEDAAINAILSTIKDPYSEYYDEDGVLNLLNSIQGNYVGIGVEITADTQTGEIVVISAYSGGPAQRAGMHSGDVLLAIDGVEYNIDTMNDAVAYMKGTNREDVLEHEMVITVRRGEEILDLSMIPEEIDMYRIEQKALDGNLLYLRYTGFSAESADKLEEILRDTDASGIIMDLRENPGGDLDAAVKVCDLFLNDGLILYTEDKDGNRQEFEATAGACELPLAILVDGGSASASEVVAGCMQARDRAVIIGEKTYGKGVSQLVCYLGSDPADGILKVTSYKNYRPDGIWLDEGVTPDVEVTSVPSLDEYGNIIFDSQGDAPLATAIDKLK